MTEMCYLYVPICGNMTSSTKPDVHNTLHGGQSRIQPQPQLTRRENSVKFICVIFETREWTERLGLVVSHWFDQRGYSMPGPDSTGMGDHLLAGKPPQFVTSHLGELDLLPSAGQKIRPYCHHTLQWGVPFPPQNCLFPWGDLHPI